MQIKSFAQKRLKHEQLHTPISVLGLIQGRDSGSRRAAQDPTRAPYRDCRKCFGLQAPNCVCLGNLVWYVSSAATTVFSQDIDNAFLFLHHFVRAVAVETLLNQE